MIIRKGTFETNSSSTHALCIGKGKLKEPYRLINDFINDYDYSTDVLDDEDYFPKINNPKKLGEGPVINLRRFHDIGRVFKIYNTVEAKLNFIWTSLLINVEYFKKEPYIEKFLDYLLSIPDMQVNYLDIKMLKKEDLARHPEYKNDSYDKPHVLAKWGSLYIVGLDSYGYVPYEEIKVVLDNEKLFWNLVFGDSKIYTGSDETDLFEDLNFSNYNYNLVGGSDSGDCYPINIFSYEYNNRFTKLIGRYKNGNYETIIYNDGTRTRELVPHDSYYDQGLYMESKFGMPELDLMEPEFPESIDLKITNYCENGCEFCYAGSNNCGEQAEYQDIIKVIDEMKPYTEIALGGGNVLTYSRLKDVLEYAKSKNVIVNITVRDIDITGTYRQVFEELCDQKLIYAAGVSITDIDNIPWLHGLETNRVQLVGHLILGLNSYKQIEHVIHHSNLDNILILGYKKVGKGKDYYEKHKEEIDKNIEEVKESNLMNIDTYKTISFDNLAIEQLEIDVENTYKDLFQGKDGKFSFYVDLVGNSYAKSSLEEKTSYFFDIETSFDDLRKERLKNENKRS